ncbi:hypothetical protein MaudCBS49596_006917 [Microsporum audouinii]
MAVSLSRRPSYPVSRYNTHLTSPPTPSYETPGETLADIIDVPLDYKCVGIAKTYGDRCRNPVAGANLGSASRLLQQGTLYLRNGQDVYPILEQAAPYLLCRRWHQNQAYNMVRQWYRKVTAFLQSQNDRTHIPRAVHNTPGPVLSSAPLRQRSITQYSVEEFDSSDLDTPSYRPFSSSQSSRTTSNSSDRRSFTDPSPVARARLLPAPALVPTPVRIAAPAPIPALVATRKHIKSNEDCPICKERFIPGSYDPSRPRYPGRHRIAWCKVRCGSNFHADCINEWRRQHSGLPQPNCPCCRATWVDDRDFSDPEIEEEEPEPTTARSGASGSRGQSHSNETSEASRRIETTDQESDEDTHENSDYEIDDDSSDVTNDDDEWKHVDEKIETESIEEEEEATSDTAVGDEVTGTTEDEQQQATAVSEVDVEESAAEPAEAEALNAGDGDKEAARDVTEAEPEPVPAATEEAEPEHSHQEEGVRQEEGEATSSEVAVVEETVERTIVDRETDPIIPDDSSGRTTTFITEAKGKEAQLSVPVLLPKYVRDPTDDTHPHGYFDAIIVLLYIILAI